MRHAAFKPTGSARRSGLLAKASGSRARASMVVCSLAHDESAMGRRQLLSAAGAAVLAAGAAPLLVPQPAAAGPMPKAVVPVEQLGLLQKQAQLKDFRLRAEAAIKEVVDTADAPACMRLVLHDAATYDAATKTGGVDGSIVLPEELSRPENAGLDVIVEKLAQAKAKIDAAGAEDGSGPISWADTIVLAAKVTTQAEWVRIKRSRAQIASGGDVIAGPAFGAAWPVRLGRVDSTVAAPAGRIPAADAPVAEIRAFMEKLAVPPGANVGGGLFSAKPPFWERPTLVLWTAAAADPAAEEERFAAADPATFKGYKQNYDRSRKTVTRTDYEVDFIDYFTLLTNLAAFKQDAYLHPESVVAIKL